MGCAGIKTTENEYSGKLLTQNSTKRVVNMAIEMMNYIEEMTLGDGTVLNIRIGIHYGRAIAGIIGHHKPQFSLIGDTVNTTSRVCSTGEVGKVTLSQEAYDEVRTRGLSFTMKKVFAKGKGDINTYILQRQQHIRQNVQKLDSSARSDIFKHFKTAVNPDGILGDSHFSRDGGDDASSVNIQQAPLCRRDSVSNSTIKGIGLILI